MFAPYCPVHHSRVLLFSDNIDCIENGAEGLTVHFHCNCGFEGTWHPGQTVPSAA
jgi:hypothetical protein